MFRLTTFSVGPYDNNVYVLSDPKSKEALLIDAANDAPRIIKELEGFRALLHYEPLAHCAFVLETPGEEMLEGLENLTTLRSLA